jgi:hypothetical protein
MAHYLVRATPKAEKMAKLASALDADAFADLKPFGHTLTWSLRGARVEADGGAVWEEEDYCSPPLAQERAAVLDDYFDAIQVEPVARGEGWRRIETLPHLFPGRQAEARGLGH